MGEGGKCGGSFLSSLFVLGLIKRDVWREKREFSLFFSSLSAGSHRHSGLPLLPAAPLRRAEGARAPLRLPLRQRDRGSPLKGEEETLLFEPPAAQGLSDIDTFSIPLVSLEAAPNGPFPSSRN